MKNKSLLWRDKYILGLKENLSVQEIQQLREVGQPKALEIRSKAIDYCLMNNIPIHSRKVPTEAIMEVTGYNLEYYYQKMIKEKEVLGYVCT